MPSIRISKELNSEIYFITFTVKNWYYIFDRHNRFKILADSIKYCQKHKSLKLYAYVFMVNHVHMIVSAPDMIAFVRDFKRYTASEIIKNIIATEPDVIKLFQANEKWEFWQKTNMPKIIESEDYFKQKINYIHNNPVRKQYIQVPEHWFWSSANPTSVIEVENTEF
ncbi:MAG: transposase [Candidatus Pacebacteria bacterium]|nr:transposase [Candidatus Paceibacterota bacterium]